jgi:hypothetical protein
MSSLNYDYLDGNAAAGELSRIFAVDITTAAGRCAECGTTKCLAEAHVYMHGPGLVARCAECGTTKCLAEAHVYMHGPGLVARCAACEHVLLRLVNVREHMFLDVRGMTYLRVDASRSREAS